MSFSSALEDNSIACFVKAPHRSMRIHLQNSRGSTSVSRWMVNSFASLSRATSATFSSEIPAICLEPWRNEGSQVTPPKRSDSVTNVRGEAPPEHQPEACSRRECQIRQTTQHDESLAVGGWCHGLQDRVRSRRSGRCACISIRRDVICCAAVDC